MIRDSLDHISKNSAVGVDGIDVEAAKKDFERWIGEMLASVHRKSYRPPAVRRVLWIIL
ncbi:MAG: hypothetical protein Q8933_13805 [Bacteroidota bacterium]|nr:hypothetical protein [Bacteroidota bacterium]